MPNGDIEFEKALSTLADNGLPQVAKVVAQAADDGDLEKGHNALAEVVKISPDQPTPSPFAPDFEMAMPQAAGETEAVSKFKSLVFSWAAVVENGLRNARCQKMMQKNPDLPVIVAEGDSWFCYPITGPKDLVSNLSKQLPVHSVARPGDLFADFALKTQLDETTQALHDLSSNVLLLSGGGNEIIGYDFDRHLRQTCDPTSFLDVVNMASVNNRIEEVMRNMAKIVDQVSAQRPNTKIFAHSYDYPVPRDLDGWLGGPLSRKNVPPELWNEVVTAIINAFGSALNQLHQRFPNNFWHMDLRGIGAQNAENWYDEIHLNTETSALAAAHIAQVVAPHREERAVG